MKKLPYGISNYEELVEDGYYYVDKTMYIEKILWRKEIRRSNNRRIKGVSIKIFKRRKKISR